MSLKKVHNNQPNEFKFTDENLKFDRNIILTKYPEKTKKAL